MNKDQIQQGDVLLKRVPKLPETIKPIKRRKGKFVLAEGEVTNHAHVADADGFVENGGEKFLVNPKSPVMHEEHNPVTLEPGIWQVGQVVEKDWLSGMVNPVRD